MQPFTTACSHRLPCGLVSILHEFADMPAAIVGVVIDDGGRLARRLSKHSSCYRRRSPRLPRRSSRYVFIGVPVMARDCVSLTPTVLLSACLTGHDLAPNRAELLPRAEPRQLREAGIVCDDRASAPGATALLLDRRARRLTLATGGGWGEYRRTRITWASATRWR